MEIHQRDCEKEFNTTAVVLSETFGDGNADGNHSDGGGGKRNNGKKRVFEMKVGGCRPRLLQQHNRVVAVVALTADIG